MNNHRYTPKFKDEAVRQVLERIEAGNPQGHAVARGNPQLLLHTSLCDFAIKRRHA